MCGKDAATVLSEIIRNQPVTCYEKSKDRYKRSVATCATDVTPDIGAVMVQRGWAIDYKQYSRKHYHNDEEIAKTLKLGIWSGRFTMPSEWRKSHKNGK